MFYSHSVKQISLSIRQGKVFAVFEFFGLVLLHFDVN